MAHTSDTARPPAIGVIIPCYKVAGQVLDVLKAVPDCVTKIYCIDDACPQKSGRAIEAECTDPRVKVIYHSDNQGVGGAVITGYKAALADGMDMAIKVDGDGQMDPGLIPRFSANLLSGNADYCKGNRFYSPTTLTQMPGTRLFGNAILSFLTKLSSGYWNVIDPTNGYTAIHVSALRLLPLDSIDRRYFFESDMLFRLNTIRAVVRDIPMTAIYGDAPSSLKVHKVVAPFLGKNLRNFAKRLAYNYYLRDFNLASFEWPIGALLLCFGLTFGIWQWLESFLLGEFASAGTVMLAALSILVGLQMLLSAFNFDIQNVPRTPLQQLLQDEEPLGFMSARLPAEHSAPHAPEALQQPKTQARRH